MDELQRDEKGRGRGEEVSDEQRSTEEESERFRTASRAMLESPQAYASELTASNTISWRTKSLFPSSPPSLALVNGQSSPHGLFTAVATALRGEGVQ
jgi:hypothetical protein